MSNRKVWRALLAFVVVSLAVAGVAAANGEDRGIDPNQGDSLVEVIVPNKAAASSFSAPPTTSASSSTTTTSARTRTAPSP
jgi:hypothetical protein